MNKNLSDLIGDYYNLQCSFNIAMKSKNNTKSNITLTDHNNFFCDLEAVQRTMIRLYKITLEGSAWPKSQLPPIYA